METFFPFILFILFILFGQAFLGSGKSKQKKSRNQGSKSASPWTGVSKTAARQAATDNGYELLKAAQKSKQTTLHDSNDKNRHRRADWGERVGPGWMSFPNAVRLFIAIIVILSVLSKLPADLLGAS